MDTTVKSSEAASVETLDEIKGWLLEIEAAEKREKDWRKEARGIVNLYECEKPKENQFNILFSNTETIAPALYNQTPRPQVTRRYKDEDLIGKAGTQVLQRTLEFLLDNDLGNFTPFDEVMPQVVLEALVPGRGIAWYSYEGIFQQVPKEVAEAPEDGEEVTDEEVAEAAETEEELDYELISANHVPWDRFLHGYAKHWKNVPWVAREHYMDADELAKNFGDAAKGVPMTVTAKESEDNTEGSSADAGEPTLAQVWELWDKESRRVLFIAPAKPDAYLRDVPDPLDLTGFFPLPQPLSFFAKIKTMVPTPLYKTYEEQAKELNRITVRINKIINSMKVRGMYDSTVEGIEKVLAADDNTLIPADNVAALQMSGGLDKAIWLMPIEKLINVLQQLYVQREQIKKVIYELNGVSDILRGSSAASESATAQNIKNQWGTLRLRKSQKVVQVFARNSLRLMAEIACKKFSIETLIDMTGLKFPREAEKAQAQQQLQLLQQQMMEQQQMQQQQAAVAQQTGQPMPPQQPPQMPPEVAQIKEMLAIPSWENIMDMLKNDLQRSYKVDIETNSTVDAEATEDKEDMGELLNAVAQFLNGIGPMIEQGILPFEAAKAILLSVVRKYRLGPDVEEQLKEMAAPQPKGDGEGEAKAAEAAQEAAQKKELMGLEVQKAQAEAEARSKQLAEEAQVRQATHQQQMEELQQRNAYAAAEHGRKMEALRLQRLADQQKAAEKSQGITKR